MIQSLISFVFNQRLLREISVWSRVRDQNVTPFFGVSFDFDRPSAPCLVSPYYQNGNIISYLKKQPAVDKLALVSYMIKSIEGIPYSISPQLAQVASGLSYLHSLSIVHGDLKGVSILQNLHLSPLISF